MSNEETQDLVNAVESDQTTNDSKKENSMVFYTDSNKMSIQQALGQVPEQIPYFLQMEKGEIEYAIITKWELTHSGAGLSFEKKDKPVILFRMITEKGVIQHREVSVHGDFAKKLLKTGITVPQFVRIYRKTGQYGEYEITFIQPSKDDAQIYNDLITAMSNLAS